jgi:hypothetical protein
MSGQMQRPKVPTGTVEVAGHKVTTTQVRVDGEVPAGFHVGYTTEWSAVQKEVPYETPKKP